MGYVLGRGPALITGLGLLLALGLSPKQLPAQVFTGYALKAGPTMATQRWDNFDQGPLFGYHVNAHVERVDYGRPTSFYAALGLHQRGSAIRSRNFRFVDPVSGQEVVVRPETIAFVFSNLVLGLGGKQHYAVGKRRGYVLLALRGEYNLATDFGDTDDRNINFGYGPAYPVEEFVRKLTYGADVGAGLELPINGKLDGLLELRFSPDVSQQYDQPALRIFNPFTGNNESAGQRRITNVSIELSAGIRILPDAVYE